MAVWDHTSALGCDLPRALEVPTEGMGGGVRVGLASAVPQTHVVPDVSYVSSLAKCSAMVLSNHLQKVASYFRCFIRFEQKTFEVL